MARRSTQFVFAFLIASCTFAQPAIYPTEVENSASYLTQGLPGSGIAQGSFFSIYGTGLGPAAYTSAPPLPLQTTLGGTSVAVTVGGQTVKCYILFTYSGQVNALLPSNTPTGSGTVTVTFGGQTSQPEPVQIVSGSFAPYHFYSVYLGEAVATDLNYQQNTIIHTFHPGDWVVLWGTGLGPISGDDSNLPPVGNIGNPTVHVGNVSLSPYYAGRSAEFPGLDQVIFQLPSGIDGCSVPVAVEINGSVGGAGLIAASQSGSTCSDSIMGSDLVSKLAGGGTVDFGFIQLFDIILRNESLPTGIVAPDYAEASFSEFTPLTAGLASYGVSNGYCLPFTNGPDMSPGGLDAGAGITVAGPSTSTLPVVAPGIYEEEFSSSTGGQFYWSGLQYNISGPGGKQVGKFATSDTTSIPSAYLSQIGAGQTTQIVAGQTLSLSGDLTVTWTGGNPSLQNGQVTIAAASNGANNTFSAFMCTTPLSTGSFTIPKWVLSTLVPSTTYNIGTFPVPEGYIWIGQFNNPVTFQASGLDKGVVIDMFFNGFPVAFK
jgi:uncharacterized protein (TIGR03437 family)